MTINGQIALTVLMGVFLVVVAAFLTRIENWRSYTPVGGSGSVIDGSGYVDEEKPTGIVRWLTTVDHKDIGILYGLCGVVAVVQCCTSCTENTFLPALGGDERSPCVDGGRPGTVYPNRIRKSVQSFRPVSGD